MRRQTPADLLRKARDNAPAYQIGGGGQSNKVPWWGSTVALGGTTFN